MKPTLEPKRKRRKKDVYSEARPWLLGTDDIPPPMRVPWQMWSKSSDPHQGGLVQFEFTPEGIAVGWYPEGYTDKHVIPWHELAFLSGSRPRDLQEEIQHIRELAESEDFAVGNMRAVREWRDKTMMKPFLSSHGEAVKEACAAIDAVFEKYPILKEYR